MTKKNLAAAAAMVLLVGAPLHAAEEVDGSFKRLDADGNGYLSPREAEARPDLIVRWNELDSDKNNLLDMSEFSAFEARENAIQERDTVPGGGMPPQ